ncbi:ABC transporter ATP-binding protein [Actinomadura livida]|uniref:ATP-binding cassette domain-containing protein n=1 Tax=Actinomadura livida TaxID=79909 RepID=A0A7W7MXI1_9ACTN|nr:MULTISPECIES: oligopeptide/dipeptide ABC transporter ATP-binding protein [Actinomadura]MBB4774713.1 peptide/nickel transport system ATP-binding protein [Actinomadura catellatispora]GGU06465.1 ABC transporter ATP-binding protein [Actinomadura livida]
MAGTGKAHLRSAGAVLRAEDLVVEFPLRGGKRVHAVSGVDFDILPGETLALVGESGSGKSTTAKAIVQLEKPTAGHVHFEGDDLTVLRSGALRQVRSRLQMVFQDPIASLNPWREVLDIVAEPLQIWRRGTRREQLDAARAAMRSVGLDPETMGGRRASELSGGQCQRVSIARALMLEPRVVICDEPVAALDVSVQAQILNLLGDLKAQLDLSMLFISHDLAVVRMVSDRVMVMYLGKICEVASAASLYEAPSHPYTTLLLGSIPRLGQAPAAPGYGLGTEIPSPVDPPSGCRFRTRCPLATDLCTKEEPVLKEIAKDHYVACHHRNQRRPDADQR